MNATDAMKELWGRLCLDCDPDDYAAMVECITDDYVEAEIDLAELQGKAQALDILTGIIGN